jgi:hypothetical protein
MFGNSHFDRMRQTFQDQFSTDLNGFIYRKNQKGVPIRVSASERDDCVTTFNKRIRYVMWSIFPATLLLILLLVWIIPDPNSQMASVAIWIGLAAILVPFMAVFYWAWNAPARELQHRTPAGAALTKEEARTLAFSKITYGRLALAAAMSVGLVWEMSAKMDVFHGGGMVWLVVGGLLIAFAGVQAIRKWRFNQQ